MATILKLEHIERADGLVLLRALHLRGAEVELADGCTFGGARLRVRPEDIAMLLSVTLDPLQRTFVLASARDAARFTEGQKYEFRKAHVQPGTAPNDGPVTPVGNSDGSGGGRHQ